MFTKQTAIMNQAWEDQGTVIGAYRFLHNPSVALDELKEGIHQHCRKTCQESDHVLILSDTSVISLNHNIGRLKVNDPHLGPIDDRGCTGFLLHVGFALDAQSGFPLGFPSINAFNRQFEQPDRRERGYRNLPVSSKESVKWQQALSDTQKLMPGKQLTFVSDRESDVYEYLCKLKESGTDFIIRAQVNRPLVGEKEKLFEFLEHLPMQGAYSIKVSGNENRKARTAIIEVGSSTVKIKRPLKYPNQSPEYLELFAIEAREKNPPEGDEPINWKLLTTHPVENMVDILKVVNWYQQRFLIEELFKLVKHKGLQLEDTQLSSGEAVKKLAYISMQVALAVMQMRMERDNRKQIPAFIVFSDQQAAFLEVLIKNKLEGKTKKQQNPFPKNSLAWASWGIARLGGWKCYGPAAGIISLKRGLEAFFYLYQGWILAKGFQDSA